MIRQLPPSSFPEHCRRQSSLGIQSLSSSFAVFLLLLLLLTIFSPPAHAEMAEEVLQHATDSASTHLFTVNPAVLTPKGLQGGILLIRQTRTSTLDHADDGGDKLQSKVQDESQAASLLTDLGAGAAIGVSHEIQHHRVISEDTTVDRAKPLTELTKIQQSAVKLLVELTTEFRVGIAIRYLFKDVQIFGDPFMSTGDEIRYKTTMVGYGSGATYRFKQAALSYTYFPPLRGKTEVEGEEKIVVEPGEIGLDGYYQVAKNLKIGLLAKRWINEIDDLAAGTTAADDQTNISLYGLDPDQYLFRRQLVLLGTDWDISKTTMLRVSLGQEQSELNFGDLMRFNRVGVNPRGDGKEQIKYYRARAMIRFANNGMETDLGFGLASRDHDFPDSWNGGSYSATEQELFATIGMTL